MQGIGSTIRAIQGVFEQRDQPVRHQDSANSTAPTSPVLLSSDEQIPLLQPPVPPFLSASVTDDVGKLDTFQGVFLPTFLSIWGVVVFVRMGWVVAQAGVVGSLGLWVLGYLVVFLTALSLSAIATNGRVRGGGPYYLISRSLGPEFGGCIGVCFFLSVSMNGVLNVLAFVEPLLLNFKMLPKSGIWQYFYGTLLILLCYAVGIVGAKSFARAQTLLALLLLSASVSIYASFLLKEPDDEVYSSFDWATWEANLWPPSPATESFQSVFSIIFAACNGVLAGASMSGELKNPSASIPSGTLAAIAWTMLLYVSVTVLLGATTIRMALTDDLSILEHISIYPPIMVIGVLATATFGAMGSLYQASSILQAISKDRILPGLSWLYTSSSSSSSLSSSGSASLRKSLTFTLFCCQLLLFCNDFTIMARLTTVFSLVTFGALNFACLLLRLASVPNFRPGFHYFNIWTALGGTLLCFVLIWVLDAICALIAVLLLIVLFVSVNLYSPAKPWGDVSQSLAYHEARRYILRLDPRKQHAKNWRPNVLLLLVETPTLEHRGLIKFGNILKKSGLYMLGHILMGPFDATLPLYQRELPKWLRLVDELKLKAFVELTISESLLEGVRVLLLQSGLGGMRPNMVVLPLSTTTTNTITALDYVEIIHAVKMTEKTVILTHGFHNWPNPNLSSKNTVNIDIWPFPSPSSSSNSDNEGLYCSFAMIIQIGHVLSLARLWRHLDVRLRVWYLVDWEHQISAERKRVEAFLRDLRVEAECRVLSLERCNPTWFDRAMRNAFSSENHSADSASTSFSAAKVTGRSEFSGPGAGETMDYGGIAQFGSPLVFARCSLRERYALLQELFLRFSDQADLLLTSLIPPDAEVRSGEMFAQSYLKTLLSACSVGPPICLIHASTVAVTTEL